MNVFVATILIAIFAFLGFVIGCSTCLQKINDLESKNKVLTEWLEASRKANESLAKECDELMRDLESVVNGGNIINNEEIETKKD